MSAGILRIPNGNGTKPGRDLRDVARGGKTYPIDPSALAHFKETLAAQEQAKVKPKRKTRAERMAERLADARKKESEPVIAEQKLVDNKASRQFQEAQKKIVDPAPVVVEQPEKFAHKTISEDEARIAHEEFLEGNETRSEVAERYGVEDFILFAKWRELEMEPARVKAKKRTYLSDDDVRAAYGEYINSNESQAKVAKRYGVSDGTLSYRFKKLGLLAKGKGNKRRKINLSDTQIRQIHQEHFRCDDNLKVVAKRHGTTAKTLRSHFKRLKLLVQRPAKAAVSAKAEIAAGQSSGTPLATLPQRDPEAEAVKVPDREPSNRVAIGREMMTGLLLLLPENGRWTAAERDKWLAANRALLDLVYEVVG